VRADRVDDALRGARRFLEADGSALDRLRIAALLGEPVRERVVSAFVALQDASGAFASPAEAGQPGVRGTLDALLALDDLGLLRATCVPPAVAQLEKAQRPDGGFEGPDAPEGERVYTTGMLAGLLAKTPFARLRTVESAADSLARGFTPGLAQSGGLRVLAGLAHCFGLIPHDRSDEILQWCGRELERGLRSGVLGAVGVARVFACCGARALPGARLTAEDLAAAVAGEQGGDGGWPGSEPRMRRVATLDAVVALLHLDAGTRRA
jgi:hypothetical protein